MSQTKILSGIRVVELAVIQAGPYAATMLGDLGAEVIKVEQPQIGDPMRYMAVNMGQSMAFPSGRFCNFQDISHSKKSVAVDIGKPEGKKVLNQLIEKADVFVTNFRASALKRMGMDHQALLKKNPRLIYAWSTTMGTKGPDAELQGIDIVAQARCGIMLQSGEEGTPPAVVSSGLADRCTALYLCYGVLGALFSREKTGKGQLVHTSMMSTMINLQGFCIAPMLMVGAKVPRWDRNAQGRSPIYNYYKCKDGIWMTLALWPGARYWPGFCRALNRPDLLNHPKFSDDFKRAANTVELDKIIAEMVVTKTYEEWRPIMTKEELLFGKVQNFADLLTDPQVAANEMFKTWNHDNEGPIKYLGHPLDFSETPMEYQSIAPELGQHTEEVLVDVLGYDWDQIGALRDSGIL